MTLTYHDGLGYVKVEVTEDGIDFLGGFAYFSSGNRDYKILSEHIVCIRDDA